MPGCFLGIRVLLHSRWECRRFLCFAFSLKSLGRAILTVEAGLAHDGVIHGVQGGQFWGLGLSGIPDVKIAFDGTLLLLFFLLADMFFSFLNFHEVRVASVAAFLLHLCMREVLSLSVGSQFPKFSAEE